jgi:hypothetical protein
MKPSIITPWILELLHAAVIKQRAQFVDRYIYVNDCRNVAQ